MNTPLLAKLSASLGSPVLSATVRPAAPSAGPGAHLVTVTVSSDALADRLVAKAARDTLPAGITGVRRGRRPASIVVSITLPS